MRNWIIFLWFSISHFISVDGSKADNFTQEFLYREELAVGQSSHNGTYALLEVGYHLAAPCKLTLIAGRLTKKHLMNLITKWLRIIILLRTVGLVSLDFRDVFDRTIVVRLKLTNYKIDIQRFPVMTKQIGCLWVVNEIANVNFIIFEGRTTEITLMGFWHQIIYLLCHFINKHFHTLWTQSLTWLHPLSVKKTVSVLHIFTGLVLLSCKWSHTIPLTLELETWKLERKEIISKFFPTHHGWFILQHWTWRSPVVIKHTQIMSTIHTEGLPQLFQSHIFSWHGLQLGH